MLHVVEHFAKSLKIIQGHEDRRYTVIWRKPVSTYAISACEALVASVNSVKLAYTVGCI